MPPQLLAEVERTSDNARISRFGIADQASVMNGFMGKAKLGNTGQFF